MSKMHFFQYLERLETTITGAIESCFPYDWNEDFITRQILLALFHDNRYVEVDGLDQRFSLAWDVRKLNGSVETDFGDVGVLIKIRTAAGKTIEGVGLLEAKRRDRSSIRFPAVREAQLRRINSNAPLSQIMLYDFNFVCCTKDNWIPAFSFIFPLLSGGTNLPCTKCICLPIRTTLQIGDFTTRLYEFGVPLSYQILMRYCRGFDLETDSVTVERVKGNLDKNGGPRKLILIGVSHGVQEPVLPDTNREVYRSFD